MGNQPESENRHDGMMAASSPGSKQTLFNPVDKGWSWVVLVCLSLIQLNCIGYMKSLGVLFVAIQEEFTAPAYMVSLILGTMFGSSGVTAMVAMGVLLNLMSVRAIVMLGGVIAVAGKISAFFTDSIILLVVSYGGIVGIGFAMCYSASLVLLGVYFDQRRAMAAAIANTGGSIGGLFLPYVTQVMLDEYGLQGTFLLMAGIFAQNIVLACFFTPPTDYKPGGGGGSGEEGGAKDPLLEATTSDTEVVLVKDGTLQGDLYTEDDDFQASFSDRMKDTQSPSYSKAGNDTNGSVLVAPTSMNSSLDAQQEKRTKSSLFRQGKNTRSTKLEEENAVRGPIYKPRIHQTSLDPFRPRTYSEGCYKHERFAPPTVHLRNSETMLDDEFNMDVDGDFNTKPPKRTASDEIVVSAGALGVASSSLPALHYGAYNTQPKLSTEDAALNPIDSLTHSAEHAGKEASDDLGSENNACEKICSSLSGIFDASLMKSPMLWLSVLYNFFGVMGVSVAVSFVPPLAVEKGLTAGDGALLLMITGALDIVSRLVPGFIAQKKWMKPQRMLIIAFVILGTTFQFCSYFNTWPALVFMAVVYGLLGGIFMSMMQLIIIDFVGLERFPRVFGFVLMAVDVPVFAVYPFLGFLRDVSGSYTTVFNTLGACLLLSAIFLLLEPLARRLEARTFANLS